MKIVNLGRTNEKTIDDGARVYLRSGYGKGVKYFVTYLAPGFCLIADCKRDLNEGRGEIYHLSAIERFQVFD